MNICQATFLKTIQLCCLILIPNFHLQHRLIPRTNCNDLLSMLTDCLSANLLPPQSIHFCDVAFKSMIESRQSLFSSDKLYYLKQYLKDESFKAVEGFVTNDESAYNDAKAMLDEHYGDSYNISEAFLNKLDCWSKLLLKLYAKEIRELTDFLKHESAMKHISELDMPSHNRQIQCIRLLPD